MTSTGAHASLAATNFLGGARFVFSSKSVHHFSVLVCLFGSPPGFPFRGWLMFALLSAAAPQGPPEILCVIEHPTVEDIGLLAHRVTALLAAARSPAPGVPRNPPTRGGWLVGWIEGSLGQHLSEASGGGRSASGGALGTTTPRPRCSGHFQ